MAKKEDIDNINKASQAQKEFNTQVKESENLVSDLSGALMGVLQELTRGNVAIGEARKGYRALLSNQQKVENVQLGLSKLSSSELKKLRDSSKLELNRVKEASKGLKDKQQLSQFEENLLAARRAGFAIERDSIKTIEKEIVERQKVEDQLGLTGVALDNLNRIGVRALGGIGVNLGALSKDFDNARIAAEETAKELADADKSNKFKVLRAALPGVGKAFKTALVDPLTLSVVSFSSLKKAFNEIQNSSIAFQRLTGQTSLEAASINSRFATTTQFLQTATALTEELGINVNNAFNPDTIAAAAEIQNTLGLSAQEAGKLALITQTTGGNFDNIKESIVDSVSAFNKVNKTAISQGVVLKDVSNASEDILATFNGQTEALTEAAAAARRLGLDLGRVDQIAGSLLDFESSIDNELQAQLLTGKELNLTRARELALVNDLAGLGKELFDNSASLTEFSSMNRIAQEAQAKALGISRQELAKIALQRSIELGLTNKNLEAAAGITAQDLERVALQDQLNLSIQKIAQSLAGPAAILASMVDSTVALNAIMISFATVALAKAYLGMVSLTKQLVKAGISAGIVRAGIGGVAGLAAVAAAATIVPMLVNRATKVDDGIIGPDGGLVVSGPKGSIQLDPNDSIVAGTNLNGSSGGNSTPVWAERLIAAVEKGGNVYIDGNKAGEALVLGSYKSA
jgi:hypothetical protein